jgi:hypothetical protein
MSAPDTRQGPPSGRCVARTRKGAPCTFAPSWEAPDGSGPLCTAHASQAGVEGARAEQQARLAGKQARKRPRRRPDASDPVADQIRVLTELRESALKRRDHQAVVRFAEQLTALLAPRARVQAEATPTPPPAAGAIDWARVLPLLSDSELACLEVGAAAVCRALALPLPEVPTAALQLPAPPARSPERLAREEALLALTPFEGEDA